MNKIETHKNETHGTSDDINENTPVERVKGPNVFERAKEEIEAIVEAFHPKKGSDKWRLRCSVASVCTWCENIDMSY